jgi:rhodanese-related sulfurtransferase
MFGIKRNAVDVKTAHAMADADGFVILDVRTKAERKEGHPPGSLHYSLESLPNRTSALEGKRILAICRSGNRSHTAAKFLNAYGIEARNVRGGMLAWTRAGLPVKKGM